MQQYTAWLNVQWRYQSKVSHGQVQRGGSI